jgi:hypothetical protein
MKATGTAPQKIKEGVAVSIAADDEFGAALFHSQRFKLETAGKSLGH